MTAGTPNLPSYLHLSVSGALPAAFKDGNVPGGAVVEDASGQPTGFLLVWVSDGFLDSIEHAWVTDQMPQEFPSVERLRRWRPEEIHSGKPAPSHRPLWILLAVAVVLLVLGAIGASLVFTSVR